MFSYQKYSSCVVGIRAGKREEVPAEINSSKSSAGEMTSCRQELERGGGLSETVEVGKVESKAHEAAMSLA